jgi:transposase
LGQAAVRIELSEKERAELTSLNRAQQTGQALATRARIVLAAAGGLHNRATCETAGVSANKGDQVAPAVRPDRLLDEPRPGAPRRIGDDEIAETVRRTLEEAPPGATHGSLRSMARATGYAPSTIHRIWPPPL